MIEDLSYADLTQAVLFDVDGNAELENRLKALQRLGAETASTSLIFNLNRVPALVIMRRCSTDEVKKFATNYLTNFGTRIISLDKFAELGTKLVSRMLAQLKPEQNEALMLRYFPETEIAAALTTRRSFKRNNAAALPRLFLDADQEWASKLDLDSQQPDEHALITNDISVRLINGIAGSGKTLIAINRALILAERYPARKILVLIHNTPIVADLKARLISTRGALPKNLEIETFFSWVHQQWRRVFNIAPNVLEGKSLSLKISELLASHPTLKLTAKQLQDEFDYINQNLIFGHTTYASASRTGRGFRVRADDRALIWRLFTAFSAQLREAKQQIWSDLPALICRNEFKKSRLKKYDHVLIDEAQFFAPSWIQLVKLALPPNGNLFLCADPNQGFMKSRLSWKSIGLNVAGRTKKLRKSYRTTRPILEAANFILKDLRTTDKDDYLEPQFEDMRLGSRPRLIYVDSPQDAMVRLANEIVGQHRNEGVPLNAMLVIFGPNIRGEQLWELLRNNPGIGSVWWLNKLDQKKLPPNGYGKDYLRMAFLDTATGLEASLVFLIGFEPLLVSTRALNESAEEWAEQLEVNQRKLYMAMTRSSQHLVIINASKSPITQHDLFDTVA